MAETSSQDESPRHRIVPRVQCSECGALVALSDAYGPRGDPRLDCPRCGADVLVKTAPHTLVTGHAGRSAAASSATVAGEARDETLEPLSRAARRVRERRRGR